METVAGLEGFVMTDDSSDFTAQVGFRGLDAIVWIPTGSLIDLPEGGGPKVAADPETLRGKEGKRWRGGGVGVRGGEGG